MSALVYTGTEQDRRILLASGELEPTDNFQVLTHNEVYHRLTAWVILHTKHASFWHGYETATADAAAAVEAIEQPPSLLSRLLGWLS